MASELRLVPRLQEEPDLDVAQLDLVDRPIEELRGGRVLRRRDVAVGGEAVAELEKARIGGPGEIVDVRLLVDVGHRSVRVVPARDLGPGRSDDEILRHRDLDPEASVVGVVLGVGVVLVTVPAARLAAAHPLRLVDAELRETTA